MRQELSQRGVGNSSYNEATLLQSEAGIITKQGASSYYKEARIRKWRNLYQKVRSIYCKVLGKLLQNRAVHLRDTTKELTHDYRQGQCDLKMQLYDLQRAQTVLERTRHHVMTFTAEGTQT